MDILIQNIQQIALGFLATIFIVGFFNTNSQVPFLKSLSNNAATYLTSIGIFFTFLGIFIALREFNVNNINTAVPKLLDGLKLAFLSSVCGIGGSIFYRIIRPLRLNIGPPLLPEFIAAVVKNIPYLSSKTLLIIP